MAVSQVFKVGTATAVDAAGFLSVGCEGANLPVAAVVGGTFVGTVIVEVSMDPEAGSPTWIPFGAAITAPGTAKVDIPCKAVRLRCSAYTSGTIVGGLATPV